MSELIAGRSSAYAMALVVWSPDVLLFKHPYRNPFPPECSHLREGFMKIKHREGDRLSPWIVPLVVLIASVLPIRSCTSIVAFCVRIFYHIYSVGQEA